MFFRVTFYAPVALSLLSLVAQPLVLGSAISRRATVCNGHAELCSRSYGNITFVGAHDSYAAGNDDNNLFLNQDQNITQQLNDGVRMLQSQVHNENGVLTLCHTSCALQSSGPLVNYLSTVKSWMNANPNEVLTLLIVNSDNASPSAFDSLFKQSGLDTLSYSPPTAVTAVGSWPTLGSMIDSGKRLVTFLSTTADFTTVPYIIDEFTNMWETEFNVVTEFNCNVNRTNGDPATQLYTINHFLDRVVLGQPAPWKAQADKTNSASGTNSLGEQVGRCAAQNARNPNFMLVDFYEFGGGSVFQIAANANGVQYAPITAVAQPGSGSFSNGTATSSNPASPSVTSTKLGGATAAFHVTGTFALLFAALIVSSASLVL